MPPKDHKNNHDKNLSKHLEVLTKHELLGLARQAGVKGVSKLRKADLIAALDHHDNRNTVASALASNHGDLSKPTGGAAWLEGEQTARYNLEHRLLEKFRDYRLDTQIDIDKRLGRRGILQALAIFAVTAIGWFTLQDVVQTQIANRLDKEFETAVIRSTIQEAAETRAEDIIKKQILPVINKARTDVDQMVVEVKDIIDGQLRPLIEESHKSIAESTAATERTKQEFDVFVESTKEEFREDLASIQDELATLKKVNEIRAMMVSAKTGEAASLDKLRDLKSSSDPLISSEATAAELDISGLLYSVRRGHTTQIGHDAADGTRVKGEDYQTSRLLEVLANHEHWFVRARAAGLIGERGEIKVLEPLLQSLSSDENLWVRGEAMRSLSRLTGISLFLNADFVRSQINQKMDELKKSLAGDDEENQDRKPLFKK